MITDYRNVRINGGFWKDMEQLNEKVTIEAVWNRFKETGRIGAFDIGSYSEDEIKPHCYWDSDVFKWIEGACRILKNKNDENLSKRVEWLIDKIQKNQGDDGYFNIHYTVSEDRNRFSNRNMHELYCAGHMFEAAVAHYWATGKDRFINIAKKYADYIEKVFVKENSAAFMTPGHEEIELALVKLYRVTGEKRYLDLALFFINNRGCNDKDVCIADEPTYGQDDVPPREMKSAVGHAVRCLYLLCGMADCADAADDSELMQACERVFDDIANYKMYVTGAVGSTNIGEAFTIKYDLPNEKAYAETCASIALMMFANRMAKYRKAAKYADAAERAMYNGMLSGMSLSGDAFFYENPLEINLANQKKVPMFKEKDHYGIVKRVEIFECSCCPPNLNRMLAAMGNYTYHIENGECYVNQYMDSSIEDDGISVVQKTNYPYDGEIRIKASGLEKVYLRIPGWCENFDLNKAYAMKNGYAVVENDGTEIVLNLEIKPVLIEANPNVIADSGKAAVMRGPIVYCAESADNIENLHSLYLSKELNAKESYSEFFRAYTIEVDEYRLKGFDGLYQKLNREYEKCRIKLIPYYGFANRGESNMSVWLNFKDE